MGLKSVHSRLLSTSLHYNMTKHVYCRWAWSLYTAVYCWLVYTTIWQSVLLSMGLKSVHSRLLSTSLHYSMTKRVYCRWAWSLYTAVYCRLVYTTVWQSVLLSMGLKSVHSRLLSTSLHYSMTKRVYCRWAWSLYTAVYCRLVYTTVWQSVLLSMGLKSVHNRLLLTSLHYSMTSVLLSMGLKSVHSRLLSTSLHYSMTKRVTVDGPEVCTQPFTVD